MSRLRVRATAATACFVLAAILGPVGLVSAWMHESVYDSQTFAERSVDMLRSSAVRHELAERLTDELAASGNQAAVEYRPAVQLAVQAVIDTDTFRAIFRNAVYRTHQAILAGHDQHPSLDLSESVSAIIANLQLPINAGRNQAAPHGLAESLSELATHVENSHVLELQSVVDPLAVVGLIGAPVLFAASLVLSVDRRRRLRLLGWSVVVGGLGIEAFAAAVPILVAHQIGEPPMAHAIQSGLHYAMGDLATIGLWVMAYGALIAAASRVGDPARYTPVRVWRTAQGWIGEREASVPGTALVGMVGLVAGLALVLQPTESLRVVLGAAGLWLSFEGITELMTLAHRRTSDALDVEVAPHRPAAVRGAEVILVGTLIVAALILLGAGSLLSSRHSAQRADALGRRVCNGSAALCNRPLDQAVFAGAHNAMSAALNPGWLLAEQTRTIPQQLDAGIRGLLIDTHYGYESTIHVPGADTPVVITDRADELNQADNEDDDPAVESRALAISASLERAPGAQRRIYLCHSTCETGAIPFTDTMATLRTWLDDHPDDVVIMILEDHTRASDNAAALTAAGLNTKAYVLDHHKPLPTLGQIAESGHNLLVFAERSDTHTPDWYQKAYDWFQESPYTWSDVSQMNCNPKRGKSSNPLLLINDWITNGEPNPTHAGDVVNTQSAIERRVDQCLAKRHLVPTIIAVDFALRGDLLSTVASLNHDIDHLLAQARGDTASTSQAGTLAPVDTPSTDAVTATTGRSGAPPGLPRPSPSRPSSGSSGSSGSTDPAGVPVTPLGPSPGTLTRLTGGNPLAFCLTGRHAMDVAGAWVLDRASASVADSGQAALSYGPLAARLLAPLVAEAPDQLQPVLGRFLSRAQAAVAALQAAGLDDAQIGQLADQADAVLTSSDPDPVLAQQQVTATLQAALGADTVQSVGTAFVAAHPLGPDDLQVEAIDPAAARAAGYSCLA
jgi:hypothetical protein